MNAQETINRLIGLRHAVPAIGSALDGPTRFADNVNTNLIDALLVLQTTFQAGAPVLSAYEGGTRVSVVHELMLAAWEGRRPLDEAAEEVAKIKSLAVIGEAMKGPEL